MLILALNATYFALKRHLFIAERFEKEKGQHLSMWCCVLHRSSELKGILGFFVFISSFKRST
jgi:hypothetical protein